VTSHAFCEARSIEVGDCVWVGPTWCVVTHLSSNDRVVLVTYEDEEGIVAESATDVGMIVSVIRLEDRVRNAARGIASLL